MKPSIAVLSLGCLIAVPGAFAQDEPGRQSRPSLFGSGRNSAAPADAAGRSATAAPAPGAAASTKADPKVFPAASVLPTPTPPDQLKPATIALPNNPIEPWLLTREAGPFMVMAKTFRGPEAERYALALAMELRRDFGLPAYILRTKDFPNRSLVRNIPPTAPVYVRQAKLTDPEKVRSYDEAAVLVGNEKTLQGSEMLLKRVWKIKPKCLEQMPSVYFWRAGLSTATRTTNPYIPTQDLFPGRGKRDHLLSQMNSGPRSIYNCPGRYTLQVAEFGGLSILNPSDKDPRVQGNNPLRKSTLLTAHDDAEKLAESLAKDPEIQRSGFQPYVYHDRTSSKVMVGSFKNPNDPAAGRLRDTLLKAAVPLAERMRGGVIIAPANTLTDLEEPNQPIKPIR